MESTNRQRSEPEKDKEDVTAKGGLVSGTKASSEERGEDIQGVAKSQQESEPEWSEEDIQGGVWLGLVCWNISRENGHPREGGWWTETESPGTGRMKQLCGSRGEQCRDGGLHTERVNKIRNIAKIIQTRLFNIN